MPALRSHPALSRFANHYGMLGVLALLCLYYSWATYRQQSPEGSEAARVLAPEVASSVSASGSVLIIGGEHQQDVAFAEALADQLDRRGLNVAATINGPPPAIRRAIEEISLGKEARIEVIAVSKSSKLVVANIKKGVPALSSAQIEAPESYNWPTFLLLNNLLNVANKIAVIAVIAVGMTMVVITGGIDLSVGSLVAFSAVLTARLIVDWGGSDATPLAMVLASAAALVACAGVGAFSGLMITRFRIPPFIATLAMMEVARGLALMITKSQSISGLPSSFARLGLKADLMSIPNVVVLMLAIYAGAHFIMARTRLGRHIYAVGGNPAAARLSGIKVNRVLLIVYIVSGAMAGLGGVIEASQFTSGDPKSGMMYELYVIAAVVIGGTSLSGGEGRILGTLIGAFIIAVIQNGMNLTEVESYTQKVVLGLVILGAVLLDMLKKQGWHAWTTAD